MDNKIGLIVFKDGILLGIFLKANNFKEQNISKYIYGIISLMPSIKKNNFLPLIKNVTNL